MNVLSDNQVSNGVIKKWVLNFFRDQFTATSKRKIRRPLIGINLIVVQNLPRTFSSPTGCHEVFFIDDHVNTVGYKNTMLKIKSDLGYKHTVRNPRI